MSLPQYIQDILNKLPSGVSNAYEKMIDNTISAGGYYDKINETPPEDVKARMKLFDKMMRETDKVNREASKYDLRLNAKARRAINKEEQDQLADYFNSEWINIFN